jgi:TonB family protein
VRIFISICTGAIALVMAGVVAAQSGKIIDHPDWLQAGDPGKLGDLFPEKAKAAGLNTGRVVLDCVADSGGRMTACHVLSEDPAALGFGDAALKLAVTMAIAPKGQDGQSVEGANVQFAVRINKPDETADVARTEEQIIEDPLWRTRPNDIEFSNAVPPAAVAKGVNGRVDLQCIVQSDGHMKDCTVLSEIPPQFGFAQAALGLSSKYSVAPTARDGRATAGRPLNFAVAFLAGANVPGAYVVARPAWAAAPSLRDLDAARAAATSADIPDLLVFRCKVGPDGGLSNCRSVGPGDTHAALGAAAGLLANFRMDLAPLRLINVSGADVELTIQWKPPAGPPSRIAEPVWTQGPMGGAYREAFPARAAALGVTRGQAGLDCLVDPRDTLTDCHVIAESPLGVAFGDSALALARDMRINAWTYDGLPPEGRRVSFAIPFETSAAATMSAGAPLRLTPRSRWRSTPSAADYARVLSPKAKAAGKNGLADLKCTAGDDGALSDCVAVWEYPEDEQLGRSALDLATRIRVGPAPGGGAIAGAVLVPVYFSIHGNNDVVQSPELVFVPTADQFRAWEQLLPDQAAAAGEAMVSCAVSLEGSLGECHVVSETPGGRGLGAAAIRATTHMQMSPKIKNGEPVGGDRVDIPFRFPPAP